MAVMPDDTSTPLTVTRSELWLEDGNIVLQAEDTQFKVHRSMLSRHSSVFRDMFMVPQPSIPNGDVVDSCAVVELSDSSEDLTHALRALYDRWYVVCSLPPSAEDDVSCFALGPHSYMGLAESAPLLVVASFLRIGRKYNIQALQAEGRRRLFAKAPITLDEYTSKPVWQFEAPIEAWFMILDLAREFEVRSVLPVAMYESCRILHGFDYDEKVIAGLSLDSQLECYRRVNHLIHMSKTITYEWCSTGAHASCLAREACQITRNKVLQNLSRAAPNLEGLRTWDQLWSDGLCFFCALQAQQQHVRSRQLFWSNLPNWFGLSSWEELRQERES